MSLKAEGNKQKEASNKTNKKNKKNNNDANKRHY